MVGSLRYRRRAVAATDALILQAEELRSAQLLVLRGQLAAGLSTRRAAMLLKLTEQRLEQLQASRHYLVEVEPTAAEPPQLHRRVMTRNVLP
jgi:hypothetical protein